MNDVIINVIKGDILDASDPVVGHCCNVHNVMGSGVAKVLRTRFPEVYDADCECYNIATNHSCTSLGCESLLGRCESIHITTRPEETNIKHVCNLYGQKYYGFSSTRYIDYEALYCAIEKLKYFILLNKFKSVAMPNKIGCVRGGGCWAVVLEMIKYIFDDTGITVNLYEL